MRLKVQFDWIVVIDPFDTLFFRDGRPFSLGEETWSNSIFPPNPATVHGALFSALFPKHKWSNANKDTLKIVGPFICNRNPATMQDIFVPPPADIFVEEKNKEGDIELAEIRNISGSPFIISQISGQEEIAIDVFPWIYSERVVVPATGKYISLYDLFQYLIEGKKPKVVKSLQDFYVVEPKIGIGIDNKTRTVEERKLYNVQMVRLKDEYSLMVFMTVYDEEVKQEIFRRKEKPYILKLGGEGRIAEAVVYDNSLQFESDLQNKTNYYRIYVLTPYKSESIPAWMVQNADWTVKGATITGYMQIGGWDMEKRKPKPMCRYVKPGSVFYVESETDFDALYEDIAWKPRNREGYGVLLPGIIEKIT